MNSMLGGVHIKEELQLYFSFEVAKVPCSVKAKDDKSIGRLRVPEQRENAR